MLPEIGHFALWLAFSLSLLQFGLPLWGSTRHQIALFYTAPTAAYGQFVFCFISFICLCWAFLQNDFSVIYVAQNSNTKLPWYYQISAVWGGHEGSLLLWVMVLAGWGAAFAWGSRTIHIALRGRVLAVLGLINAGFLGFVLFTSNPFNRYLPFFPLEGQDLNPLLQDPGLIFHPPLLYMGYVGFAVAFACVIAALWMGRLDSAWARYARPWTTAAWGFLTLGISLGSFWAYYELGWGGWWFWDPVENASFMPWLAGTALMHSLAATEKRGVFRAWTVLLAILTFSLSLLGAFLVRSGVLTSVHSFASDPSRGMFILALLVVITGGALLLVALRAPLLQPGGTFSLVSREMGLLINNLLLMAALSVVFIGTLFPLAWDVLGMGKLSVGPPYFNLLFLPLMMVLMAFLGVGPLLRWKQHEPHRLVRLIPFALLSLVAGFALPYWGYGEVTLMVGLAVGLAIWVTLGACVDVHDQLRHRKNKLLGLMQLPRSYVGMVLGHLGLAVTTVGIALTSAYSTERDVRLGNDQTATVGPYDFHMINLRNLQGPNYTSTKADIEIIRRRADGTDEIIAILHPEKRFYTVRQMPMTEVGLLPGFTRDLYVALGEPLPDGAWAVRIQYKPFMRWVWGGTLLMALGGGIALSDRRYRLKHKVKNAQSQVVHA